MTDIITDQEIVNLLGDKKIIVIIEFGTKTRERLDRHEDKKF